MPTTQDKLNKLRTLRIKRDLLEREIRDLVAVLRSPDMDGWCEASWADIGKSLDVTKQAAQQRYGGPHKGVEVR